MRDAFERARRLVTSAVARCQRLVLHLYFSIRSRSSADRVFHLSGSRSSSPGADCRSAPGSSSADGALVRSSPTPSGSSIASVQTTRGPHDLPLLHSLTTLPVPVPAQELGTGVALSPHVGGRPPPPRTLAIVVNDRDEAMEYFSVASLLVWVAEAASGTSPSTTRTIRPRLHPATRRARGQGDDGERRARRGAPACACVLRRADDVDGIIRTTERSRAEDATFRRAAAANLHAIGEESSGTGTESVTTTVDLLCGGTAARRSWSARRRGEGRDGTGTGTPGRRARGQPHPPRSGVDEARGACCPTWT